MDGNGRWANERGLPRNEGHRAGEAALLDIVAGAIEMGIPYISAYAFSTENWKRSPSEVSFIMRFSTEVLNRQLETLKSWGVRIRWAGRRPKLWKNVISQLEQCERETINNTTCTLTMCVNYGGRAEIADAAATIAQDVQAGILKPSSITEKLSKNTSTSQTYQTSTSSSDHQANNEYPTSSSGKAPTPNSSS